MFEDPGFFLTEQTKKLLPIIIFKNVFKISKCFDWNIWNRPRFRIETKYLQNIWKYIYEDLSNLYFVKREIGKNATLSINKRKTFKGKSAPWNLQQVDGAVKITFNSLSSTYLKNADSNSKRKRLRNIWKKIIWNHYKNLIQVLAIANAFLNHYQNFYLI